MWCTAILHDDLGTAAGQPFARSQIEGNICEAPIVDVQLQSDKSFGARIACDMRFLAVARHRFPTDGTASILAANGDLADIRWRDGTNGFEKLHLLIANGVGIERCGRFHANE